MQLNLLNLNILDFDGHLNFVGLHKAINRLVPDKEIRRKIFIVELQDYKKAQGYLFSSPECIESRTTLAPGNKMHFQSF